MQKDIEFNSVGNVIDFVLEGMDYDSFKCHTPNKRERKDHILEFWFNEKNSGEDVFRIIITPPKGPSSKDIREIVKKNKLNFDGVFSIIVESESSLKNTKPFDANIEEKITFLRVETRLAKDEVGVDYDLKYFGVDGQDIEPMYLDFFEDLAVKGRSLEGLKEQASEVFSLKQVTTKFYKEFSDIFHSELKPAIKGMSNREENIDEYAQLVVNRVLFLMFVQEKGWLDGDKAYIQNKYQQAKESDRDVYEDFFEPLFFEALNVKGVPEDDFLGRIPYLNGGLFEKNDIDKEVTIDENFFDVLLDTEEDEYGEKKGFLQRYKLSLSETNPSEQELVVDPEFIGRIFEMFMQSEERSEKGAFYTHKEITQYMSKNSIKEFLLNHFNNDEEAICELLNKHKIPSKFEEKEVKKLKKLIDDITVLDPAVGSGAFIISMIEELVGITECINNSLGIFENRYDLKERFIAQNLYGVDIDPSGIELCKFRTWLYLIQDLSINLDQLLDENDKYALPNLDFKFFVGNSLVGDWLPTAIGNVIKNNKKEKGIKKEGQSEFREGNLQLQTKLGINGDRLTINDIIEKIAKVRKEFVESHGSKKREKEKELKKFIKLLDENINWEQSDNLMTDIFDKTSNPFKWSVRIPEVILNGGFDICIMNPPYEGYGRAKYVKPLRKFLEERGNIDFFDKTDLYQLFIHRVFELTKHNAVICIITSDSYFKLKSKKDIREKLFDKELKEIVDVNFDAFDARVWTSIITVKNVQGSSENFDFTDASESDVSSYRDLIQPFTDIDKYDVECLDLKVDRINHNGISIYNTPKKLIYKNVDKNIFTPTERNIELYCRYIKPIYEILEKEIGGNEKIKEIIDNITKIEKYQNRLEKFLDKSDYEIYPLGIMTVGGQGMATGKNSKYLGVLEGTAYAEKIKERGSYYGYTEDNIISKDEVIDIKELSKEEKLNGLDNQKRCYVEYQKGSNKGRKWYDDNPFFIRWTEKTINEINENGVIRNKKYYFKGGFTWSNLSIESIKARIQPPCVFDVGSMTLNSFWDEISNKYLVSILNYPLTNIILKDFINHTANIQVNDIRYLPVVIPSSKEQRTIEKLVDEAILIQKKVINKKMPKEKLMAIEKEIYGKLDEIYENPIKNRKEVV